MVNVIKLFLSLACRYWHNLSQNHKEICQLQHKLHRKIFDNIVTMAKPIKLFFIIPLVSRVLTMIESFQTNQIFAGKARTHQHYPQEQTL